MDHDKNGTLSDRLLVGSIARAVWRQDSKLAKRLLDSSPVAAQFLFLSGNQVLLIDPDGFDKFSNLTRQNQKQESISTLQKEKSGTSSVVGLLL